MRYNNNNKQTLHPNNMPASTFTWRVRRRKICKIFADIKLDAFPKTENAVMIKPLVVDMIYELG